MTAQLLLLLVQIMFSSDAEHVEIQRNGGEIRINVDGEEYRMIQPVIGEGAVYENNDLERQEAVHRRNEVQGQLNK